jgi:predicted DNA-binding protein (MmcQ/YjbR family)
MARAKTQADTTLKELRAFGLAYPGAHTKSPWPGHLDLAVNDKTFAYLSLEGEPLNISCKLPQSNAAALLLPFTKPTGYGLGKSGWVSASFPLGAQVPVGMLKEWIDESYRAQAPKKLVRALDAAGGGPPKKIPAEEAPEKKMLARPRRKSALKKAPAKKAPPKKASPKKVPAQKAAAKKAAAKKK